MYDLDPNMHRVCNEILPKFVKNDIYSGAQKIFEIFLGFYLIYMSYEISQYLKLLQKCCQNEKIKIFEILAVFWGIFQKFQFLENFELWYESILLNETFSKDLSSILKNNQHVLDEHGNHFMRNVPIFQNIFFSKMFPKSRES